MEASHSMNPTPQTPFQVEAKKILRDFAAYASTNGGSPFGDLPNDEAKLEHITQGITDLVDKLVISQDRFSDTGDLPMMEAIDCENNENAQNRLRAEQRRVINR